MSNPRRWHWWQGEGRGLLQSVGNGSEVHSEEKLVGGTVVQACAHFTSTMCTRRAFCCFLKWYTGEQGPSHTVKEDCSGPRCVAPPAVFFLFVLISIIYKMPRLSLGPFSYRAYRPLCWGICEITSQKSQHLLWLVTWRFWGLYIARGLNGLEIFLLLAKDLGVKLLTWDVTRLGIQG